MAIDYGSFEWPPSGSGSGGGITSINSLTGPAITLAAGTNITITPSGNTLTIASTGGSSGVTTLTAVGASPNANGGVISGSNLTLEPASASFPGVLLAADWTTFNSKQNALTIGNLTDAGTDGITVTGGTGAVIGSGTSISQHVADATHNGYLLSTDWVSFNGKQASGNYITALTGDVTASGPGSVTATLATVNGNVGSFGSSTSIPSFTVNGKGLITAASGNVVIAPAGTLTGATLASGVTASSLTSLGTQAVALNMGTHLINNVVDPSAAQDAATKAYVDNAVSQLNPLTSVYAGTIGSNIAGTYANGASGIGATFTTTSTATFTLDGTTPPLLSRILFKDQTSGFQNGVYTFTTAPVGGVSGAIFTRALDYDTASDMNAGNLIPILNGTVNQKTSWAQTAVITTVGTDALTFVQFTQNPSSYLQVANNLSDVASKTTSFNNLSPMTTGGDLIYGGASGTGTRLANGTAGQVLTSQGTTLAPQWATATAGAVVAASYYSSVNSSSSTTQSTNFDTLIYDPLSLVTASAPGTGTWRFTAPQTGLYLVSVYLNTTGSGTDIEIAKNGSPGIFSGRVPPSGVGQATNAILLNATDFIDIRCLTSTTVVGGTLGTNQASLITVNLIK